MSKKVLPSALQGRTGIAAINLKVVRELRWIFREQPTDDYGIDAQIEVADHNGATGRLIAAQIKSGQSYFGKPTQDGWWLPLDAEDLEYWREHALPVIVLIYDPETDSAYWEAVSDATVITGKRGGKKILIPRGQLLESTAAPRLSQIAEGKPYELRIRRLRLALPWMRLLESGRRVLLEAAEWINKTSGRGDIQIVSVDDANEDRQELGGWYIMVGLRPYEEVLPSLVPWADVVLHEETYADADHAAWEEECVHYDREGDRFENMSFDQWISRFAGTRLRPYMNGAGEVDHWRLELLLNDLGRSFLAVDRFAEGHGMFLAP